MERFAWEFSVAASTPSFPSLTPTENETNLFFECLLLVLFASVGALLPSLAVVTGSPRGAVLVAFGNAFAGGVLLCVGLVHMLGDAVQETVSGAALLQSEEIARHNKILFTLCIAGVLIPFAFERGGLLVVFFRKSARADRRRPARESHWLDRLRERFSWRFTSADDRVDDEEGTRVTLLSRTAPSSPPTYATFPAPAPPAVPSAGKDPCVVPSIHSTRLQARLDFLREADAERTLDVVDHAALIVPECETHDEMALRHDELSTYVHGRADPTRAGAGHSHARSPRTSASRCDSHSHGHHAHADSEEGYAKRHTHFATSWMILTLVFVSHSVMAGFTLGIQPPASRGALLTALLLHKLFESFAMGSATQTRAGDVHEWLKALHLIVFVCAAPMGLILGRTLALSADAPSVGTRARVTAFSAGSFLYIALVEIIHDEFMDEAKRIQKFAAFVAGVVVMLLVD